MLQPHPGRLLTRALIACEARALCLGRRVLALQQHSANQKAPEARRSTRGRWNNDRQYADIPRLSCTTARPEPSVELLLGGEGLPASHRAETDSPTPARVVIHSPRIESSIAGCVSAKSSQTLKANPSRPCYKLLQGLVLRSSWKRKGFRSIGRSDNSLILRLFVH